MGSANWGLTPINGCFYATTGSSKGNLLFQPEFGGQGVGLLAHQAQELFDMSDAPFVEKPVAASADTAESKAARERLTKVLAELNPAGGKTDGGAGPNAKKAGAKKKKAGNNQ